MIPFRFTLGARDFSSAVSGFCQVFIVTRAKSLWSRALLLGWPAASPLVASAYGGSYVGLRPKIPAAREKNIWYPGYFHFRTPQNCVLMKNVKRNCLASRREDATLDILIKLEKYLP